jgi:hypothetical protein
MPGPARTTVAVNYAGNQGQCRLPLSFPEVRGKQVRLTDVIGTEVYDREGSELVDHGLYIDHPPSISTCSSLECYKGVHAQPPSGCRRLGERVHEDPARLVRRSPSQNRRFPIETCGSCTPNRRWAAARGARGIATDNFLFVGFNFIVLTANLLVAEYLVAVSNFMLATIAALVVGKAVLVANAMPYLRR